MFPAFLVGSMLLHSGGVCRGAIIYTDSFEGPGLDPFWTTETTNGTVTVPSPAAAHTGSNSAQFNSTAGDREIFLRHDFATEVYGTASVWVYDTGADSLSSNYLILQLYDLSGPGAGDFASIGTFDYDFGAPDASSYYNFNSAWGQFGPTASSTDRTQAWHHWMITSTPTAYEIRIDGTLVHATASGRPFDMVRIGMFGPDFRPDWVGYFDDFQFEEFNAAVPEPTCFAMVVGGVLGSAALGLRRRRTQSKV